MTVELFSQAPAPSQAVLSQAILSQAIETYLAHIRHNMGHSPRTCATYASWLRNFQGWLAAEGYAAPTVADFNALTLNRYLHSHSQAGKRPRTIHSIFNPLRGLGVYLAETGILPSNPALLVKLPKKDAAIRRVVTRDEAVALLDACERQSYNHDIALSRALLNVCVYGGLRRQEMLDLKTGDVDLEDGSILVRSGKGAKSRKVFVCEQCVSALREWRTFRERMPQRKGERQGTPFAHDWLWAWNWQKRISAEGAAGILTTLKAIAGLKTHTDITFHSLRHFAATNLMRSGADLRSVQSFLGHSSIAVTAAYLHTDEERLRQVAQLGAIMPRAAELPQTPRKTTYSAAPGAMTQQRQAQAVSEKGDTDRTTLRLRRHLSERRGR